MFLWQVCLSASLWEFQWTSEQDCLNSYTRLTRIPLPSPGHSSLTTQTFIYLCSRSNNKRNSMKVWSLGIHIFSRETKWIPCYKCLLWVQFLCFFKGSDRIILSFFRHQVAAWCHDCKTATFQSCQQVINSNIFYFYFWSAQQIEKQFFPFSAKWCFFYYIN